MAGCNLLLNLHVQPNAKKNLIASLHGEKLKIKVKAAPVDGKANRSIIAFLAREFSVSKSAIELVSGDASRNKKVLINNPALLPDWFKQLSG